GAGGGGGGGGGGGSRGRQSRILRLERGDSGGVYAAHLARADAERTTARAEHDGVRFDELRHAPREQQVGNLCCSWLQSGDRAQLRSLHVTAVRRLHQEPAP